MAIPLGLGGGSVDAALNNFVALHYKSKHMSWLHCFWGLVVHQFIIVCYMKHQSVLERVRHNLLWDYKWGLRTWEVCLCHLF